MLKVCLAYLKGLWRKPRGRELAAQQDLVDRLMDALGLCLCGAIFHDRPDPEGPQRCWEFTLDPHAEPRLDLGRAGVLTPIDQGKALASTPKLRVSHGLCVACLRRQYPEFADRVLSSLEKQPAPRITTVTVCVHCNRTTIREGLMPG